MAMVVFPFTQWFVSDLSPWWMLFIPLCFWGFVIACVVLYFLSRSTGLMSRIAMLPGPRGLTVPLVVHNSFMVINAGLEAGMLMPAVLRLAAESCGSRIMGARIREQAEAIERKRTPDLTAALQAIGFPNTYVGIVRSGETGGNLDESLRQASDIARESFRSRVTWTTRVILGTIYLLILLTVAAAILGVLWQVWFKPLAEIRESMG
jgi:type II secretory pathway component PulF